MSAGSGRRAFVLVIDACGVGALPDAADYGDEGTNTLVHLAEAVGGLKLATLARLGLGSVVELAGVPRTGGHGVIGRLHPLGPGKDSISGHWELMGVVLERPLPTYPQGFPAEVLERLRRATGHELVCNRADDGLRAVEEFGAEHLRGGALILYTSQDSVLQLAAHTGRLAPQELYAACERARAAMSGEHAVGRVIARPFEGSEGNFRRTEGRRDYALEPPRRSWLQALEQAGVPVHGVGKIRDLFASRGVSHSHPGATNARALHSIGELAGSLERGLVFANLIETDQIYGHRKDVHGFHRALQEIDAFLGGVLRELRDGDLLVVTADHGVDPAHPGTDHTREHVPLLAVTGAGLRGGAAARRDGPMADVGASVYEWLRGAPGPDSIPGRSFLAGAAPGGD